MSDAPKDGGPAFPTYETTATHYGPMQSVHGGMSLRDWFAGQAPAWWLAEGHGTTAAETAAACYAYADAMLAEREKVRELTPEEGDE